MLDRITTLIERHAQRARQRRARSADADDAPARHAERALESSDPAAAARSAVDLPRRVGSHPRDARHADGHLRSRNRRDAARPHGRARRSASSTRRWSIYEDVAEERRITRDERGGRGTRSSYADRDRLRQVLANLLDNAIKYTPRRRQRHDRGRREADAVVIEVADTGMGIAAARSPAHLGTPVSRRPEPRRTRPRARPEPRPRHRPRPSRNGRRDQRTRPRFHLYRPPLALSGGLRPAEPPCWLARGAPTPRSARQAHSLPLVRAICEIACSPRATELPNHRAYLNLPTSSEHCTVVMFGQQTQQADPSS